MDVDEVLTRLGPRATASHETAARLWGIELVEDGLDRVTVPVQRSRVEVPGWVVRRLDLPSNDIVVVDGLRRTIPLRTVLDLAQVLRRPDAVAAADSALRQRLVEESELRQVLSTRRGRAASGPRAVAALADRRAESVLESLIRYALAEARLPAPVLQREIHDEHGRFVARVDFCWPEQRLVVEADGFAFHSDRVSFRSDRTRLNTLERLGWRVLRFCWEDVRSDPAAVAAVVRECLERQRET